MMDIGPRVKDVIGRVFDGYLLKKDEILYLLGIDLEPNMLGAISGANLFWAEAGSNPRDTEAETSKGRGLGVKACIRLFREADFDLLKGPSAIYSENDRKVW